MILCALLLSCAAVPGLDPFLAPGSVILLGEIHGTNESPRFASRAACLAASKKLSVTVGLEIPADEQDRIERGDFSGPFWTDPYQDGRRSKAMTELIETLRKTSVRLLCIDRAAGDGRDRDFVMADHIRQAVEERPSDVFIILTGNNHSRLSFDPVHQWMGFLLTGFVPSARVVAFDVSYSKGTAWTCTGGSADSCGVHSLRGDDDDSGVRVTPSKSAAYSGTYSVGRITASEPFRKH